MSNVIEDMMKEFGDRQYSSSEIEVIEKFTIVESRIGYHNRVGITAW
jgi:hypothetical protein